MSGMASDKRCMFKYCLVVQNLPKGVTVIDIAKGTEVRLIINARMQYGPFFDI